MSVRTASLPGFIICPPAALQIRAADENTSGENNPTWEQEKQKDAEDLTPSNRDVQLALQQVGLHWNHPITFIKRLKKTFYFKSLT